MSTSKSQAEIDFENATEEELINPKSASRPRAGQEELPIGTLVEAVLRGEQELGARPTMNRQTSKWVRRWPPHTQALGEGGRCWSRLRAHPAANPRGSAGYPDENQSRRIEGAAATRPGHRHDPSKPL